MTPATSDGLLLVDKPAGLTSHDVVLAARRACGEGRVGHTGTLDPFATGLLVLLLGRATRLLPFLDGSPKEYEAEFALGVETDTDDLHGAVLRTAPPPAPERVSEAIAVLTGALDQVPPTYSAKRVRGERAYAAARAGHALELPAQRVHVYGWRDVRRDGDTLWATISCGGGTYIRALARDLGRLSGSAAHLRALRRIRNGPFVVRDAVSLETLRSGRVRPRPALEALPTIPHVQVEAVEAERLRRGHAIARHSDGDAAALVDAGSGALVAYAVAEGERWQPRVVMHRDG